MSGDPTINSVDVLTIQSTDDNGCTAIDTKNITIKSTATAMYTKQDISCFTVGEVVFSFVDHPNRTSIKFSVDGGTTYFNSVPDNSSSVNYYLSAGSYHAFVKWGDNSCPVDLGAFDILDDGTSVSMSLSTNSIRVCEGDAVTLSPSLTGGTGPFTYSWDNGSDNGVGLTFIPPSDPNSNVISLYEITVTDFLGCIDIESLQIESRSLPSVTNVIVQDGCAGTGSLTFQFEDHTNRSAIEFSTDAGASYYSQVLDTSGEVTYNLPAGTYSCFTRWGNNECPIDLGTYTINNSNIDIEIGGNLSICEGEEVTLSPVLTGGLAPFTYTWDNGSETGSGLMFSPGGDSAMNLDISYIVKVTDSNGCESTDDIEIEVKSNPTSEVFARLVSCSGNGEVVFTFPDHPDYSALQFSLDGGINYELSLIHI